MTIAINATGTTRRPLPITVIAVYQFFAAGFLLVVVLLTICGSAMQIDSSLFVRVVTYVTSGHNLVSAKMIPIVMPVVATYRLIVGAGLLGLKKWARHLLIATSGVTVLIWLRGITIRQWALGESLFRDELARETVYAVIVLNAVIFLCLTVYPDVVEAFEDRSARS